MNEIRLTFPNRNGLNLSARIQLPTDQHPIAFAIFAHCFTCNKNFNAVRNITRMLSLNGIGVMSFDFTGLGGSEGKFSETAFSSNIRDIIDASGFLTENYQTPQLLIGHSLGGAAILAAAQNLPFVRAVSTIGSPADPIHVKHLFEEKIDLIQEKGAAQVRLGNGIVEISKAFLDDLEEQDPKVGIPALKKSLLILHSPQDKVVGIENAAEIYHLAKHPKSFVSLDGMDHMLFDKRDSQYVGNLIANWATRYLPKKESIDLKTDAQVLVRLGNEGFTSEIKSGNHYFLADEPETVGGNDFGPSPYELLSASLGSCTAMTLRMYADRKKWDLQEVKVHIDHGKSHVEGVQGKGKIDVFERKIELEGNLDKSQKIRLLEIADRCPVHRTLHQSVQVQTILIEN